jgi:glutaredoxin 3
MFTIYSKPNCQYCDKAKRLLASQGIAYLETIIDVGQPKLQGVTYISRDEFLQKFPTSRTVPQITLGDEHLGDYEQLKSYLLHAA